MLARLSAFVIWALVAASAVFWGLRLWTRSAEAPGYTVPVGDVAAARGDLTRVLGATPVATAAAVAIPEVASRFRLLGIMAPKASAGAGLPSTRQGVALIAVDGKPPKAFVVGSSLDTGLVLQSVSHRTASIGAAQGAPAVTLELPPLAAAATGTLPPPGIGTGSGSAPRNPAAAMPVPPAPPAPVAPQAPMPVCPAPPPVAPQGAIAPAPPVVAPVPPAVVSPPAREPGAQSLAQ
jgi:general secretion pathway protein C